MLYFGNCSRHVLWLCFLDAVRKRFPQSSDVEVLPAIQNWLRHAPDKYNTEKRKGKKPYDRLQTPRPAWPTIPATDDAIEHNILSKQAAEKARKKRLAVSSATSSTSCSSSARPWVLHRQYCNCRVSEWRSYFWCWFLDWSQVVGRCCSSLMFLDVMFMHVSCISLLTIDYHQNSYTPYSTWYSCTCIQWYCWWVCFIGYHEAHTLARDWWSFPQVDEVLYIAFYGF